MTKPVSVGRIVHFGAMMPARGGIVAHAALVTRVHDETSVDLHVVPPMESSMNVDRVPYSETLKEGHWTWPVVL